VRARRTVKRILDAGLGMGKYVAMAPAGTRLAGHEIPRCRVGFGTVCSVTLNGVLKNAGIPTVSRFGGLLEMRDRKPYRFTQIIQYDGTTIDPIEIFIKGKMTSVGEVARTGNGTIGASFREIPAAALPRAQEAIAKMTRIGLNGVLLIGMPGESILGVPVQQGRVGLVVAAGLNPIAAVEESGTPTENHAMAELYDFDKLVHLGD
jgi:repressor of nif and glnA expression